MAVLKNTEKNSVGPSITGTGDQRCGSCFNEKWCDGGLYAEGKPTKCLLYCSNELRIREKWEVM